MQVRVLKMSNGDELIGRVSSTGYFSHLFITGLQQSPDGRFGMVMMPYLNSAPDAEVELNPDLIVCRAVPTPEIEKNYLERSSKLFLG